MNSSLGLRSRVLRLEDQTASAGVAGIVSTRGGSYDPAEQKRLREGIAALHKAGHSVVYVAHLALRHPDSGAKA